MKTEKLKLSQVRVNSANPRTIKEAKLNQLVERLLVFPKMIAIRPVVIDDKNVVLGGNMRVNALNKVAGMQFEQVADIIGKTKNYQRLTQAEKELLLQTWQNWLEAPTVEIVRASTLTEEEKKEFIIADNASFGEWDYDKLANNWDAAELKTWGVDVWQPEAAAFGQGQGYNTPSPVQQSDIPTFDTAALPEEIQGLDVSPDDLPKIEGSDETAMERIIIVYPKEREDEVAKLIGLSSIDKVVYPIDEILG